MTGISRRRATGAVHGSQATTAGFGSECAASVLVGVRVAVILALIIIPSFVFVDYLYHPDRARDAVLLRAGASLLLALLFGASYLRLAVRLAGALAAAVVVVLSALIIGLALLSDGLRDPYYVLQVMGLIFVITGAGQLFPLSGPSTFALVSIPFVLHVVYAVHFGFVQNLPLLIATSSAVAIATAGAGTSHRHRVGEYEGRRANESLQREKGDFIAMVTHDIKNPLSVISGYVEILRDGEPMSKEILDALERASSRALMLAGNFLNVSRLDDGSFELRRQPTDVARLLREAIAGQRRLAEARDIVFVERIDELPGAEIDEAQFERVLVNLLSNAIEHCPVGSRITVTARSGDARTIEIEVANSGKALGPERLATLFRRYDPQSGRHQSSTGLGLYIVKTITEAHGGSVVAEQADASGGVRFRLSIPAMSAGAAPSEIAAPLDPSDVAQPIAKAS